jgi:4,5-dihydroxyphthalate decarboxylase
MSALSLTAAVATYGHTRPLWDGTISSERVALEHIELSPITRAFRRMVRGLDFDISEMALSTYLCARAYHKPMTALPIFLTRRFEHGQIVYNVKSGIRSPSDLAGRRVGVRSYTLTPGVWVRGILQSAYGVDLEKVTWVLVGDEHVAEYVAPSHVVPAPTGSDLGALLHAGDIDAAIGLSAADAPDIHPLIPDPQHAAIDFFRQTGIYPISHIVVLKDALLQAHPWLAEELCTLFKAAKDHYLRCLNSGGAGDAQDKRMNELRQVVGDDPLPYGIAANRATLEAFIRFNVEQKVMPHPVNLDDLFPPSVLGFA